MNRNGAVLTCSSGVSPDNGCSAANLQIKSLEKPFFSTLSILFYH